MPIYKLKCGDCGERFDDFRNIRQLREEGRCIRCGSRNLERGEEIKLECGCGCGCEGVSISGAVAPKSE